MTEVSSLEALCGEAGMRGRGYTGMVFVEIDNEFVHCVARYDDEGDIIITPTPLGDESQPEFPDDPAGM